MLSQDCIPIALFVIRAKMPRAFRLRAPRLGAGSPASHLGQSESSVTGAISISMPALRSFIVSAAGCAIRLETDSDEVFYLLNKYLFPSLDREPGTCRQADINLQIGRVEEQFQLRVDGAQIAASNRPENLLRQALDCLDRGFIRRLKDMHAIHAGAVLIGDRVLLLPGGSHSGKSSLVAEFLRRGLTCFSDEYALIDSQGRAHAYPRVLLLRNGGIEQTPTLPEDCNANSHVAVAPAPVGWIFSLRYESTTGWKIAPVAQSSALLCLLQNTPHVLAERPQMVAPFNRAVEGAVCYAGSRVEASEAVDQILRLIGSTA